MTQIQAGAMLILCPSYLELSLDFSLCNFGTCSR